MSDDPHARGQEPWTIHPPRARDIAITGIGCRFPGGVRDLDGLWQVLLDGLDVTGDVPADRWGPRFFHPDPRHPGTTYCPRGGFLDEVDRFDASFFGISSREACELDPQQRLLLETAWSAMEDSGTPRDAWKGSRTGVFAGVLGMDYALLHAKTAGIGRISPYYASGKEFSFGAGRISYTFGLNGPCVMLNSACSSSLMAVHLACQALRGGECDAALAGGVNLMLAPELSVFMSKIDALSPSGVCRPFDAHADGVVRGEGCGVVVLKRHGDAVANGDRIWAVIRGSAANHDGRSAGLTAPNAAAQQMLLRAALDAAQVDPADLDYVEAHGTGTPLGDPLEISSLAAVIGSARAPGRPLLVGSHKANFGHLDSAAGVLGLLKGVLVARKGIVPPQINLNRPTPAVDWEESGVRVPTEPTPLPGSGPRVIGVNAFGLSGSNAHVVLTSPPAGEPGPARPPGASGTADAVPGGPGARLLVLSGPTPEAVAAQAGAYRDRLPGNDAADLADLLYSASARRTHHDYRLAVTGESAAELAEALSAHQRGEAGPGIASDDVLGGRPSRVVHVFSGQGSQWPGMGMDLYRCEPVVRESLDECEQIVRDIGGWSILTETGHTPASRLTETEIAQPAIFAVQLALTRLWASWGLVPDAVLGHSMGEVAAACAAGALGVQDAIRLIVRRGQIMQRASGTGRMTAVELPAEEVRGGVA
jgi:acyl transferase domain-containing protein